MSLLLPPLLLPPAPCSCSHSSLSLSTWTESPGASKAWTMGDITGRTLVAYPHVTQAQTEESKTLTRVKPPVHIDTLIQIHTLNSTRTGCVLWLRAAFLPVVFCGSSGIDHVGLWGPCRVVSSFLSRFDKVLSLWQREEASLRMIQSTGINVHGAEMVKKGEKKRKQNNEILNTWQIYSVSVIREIKIYSITVTNLKLRLKQLLLVPESYLMQLLYHTFSDCEQTTDLKLYYLWVQQQINDNCSVPTIPPT